MNSLVQKRSGGFTAVCLTWLAFSGEPALAQERDKSYVDDEHPLRDDGPKSPRSSANAWAAYSGVELSGGYQRVQLTSAIASSRGIGRVADGFAVEFGARLWRLVDISLDVGRVSMKDNASFTEITTCQSFSCGGSTSFGDTRRMGSEVSSLTWSASVGAALPPLVFGHFAVDAGLNLGAFVFDPSRSIDACSDCMENHWPTIVGMFVEPHAQIGYAAYGRRERVVGIFGVSFAYRRFIDDSRLVDAWSVGLNFSLFERAAVIGAHARSSTKKLGP